LGVKRTLPEAIGTSTADPGCVKLFFGGRDETLIQKEGLRRNNESS